MAAPNKPKMITPDGEPVVHFDLDAQEHEAREEAFTFRHGGEIFTMLPPEDADWLVTSKLGGGEGDLAAFVAELLGDDYERFAEHPLSTGKLTALLDECRRFYGTSEGESKASRRSSKGTRRR